jgi:penicillin amidase
MGIDLLPIEEELELPTLGGAVSAVQDDRGMWHIYAQTLRDAFLVEGFLMARDRFPQLEFIRSSTMGELARIAGALDPSLFDRDVEARFIGFRRQAIAIEAGLSDEDRALLEAFAAGVNAHIAELRDGRRTLPAGAANILSLSVIRDWTPVDTIAIARFQAASLSFSPFRDFALTDALRGYQEAFSADSEDPARAARAGGFHDLVPFAPAEAVFSRDGFPNLGTDMGTRALRRPGTPGVRTDLARVPPDSLGKALRFTRNIEERFRSIFGDASRGSNSWVVSGSHTASGFPILANDPHLQLPSPPLFWYVHIDTKRAGGDVNVQGLALAGTPVILLGYNERIAWGLTTSNYDVTDVYLETVTPGVDGPDTVSFQGRQVPIETVWERIETGTGAAMQIPFDRVPHHGLVIPDSRTATSMLTVKWTGEDVVPVGAETLAPSNEISAFLALSRATDIDSVREAFSLFGVGSQSLVAVSADNEIFWTSHARVPVRDPRALTYDPATQQGVAPSFVLSGTGDHEWTGLLSNRFLPHALNPAEGFIATANGDPVGTNADGNPFNDAHYVGWDFNTGHRMARIDERLDELIARGAIDADDMSALQGDVQSPIGGAATAALVAAIDRALEEHETPGTHPDLTDLVAAETKSMPDIRAMRDRLAAWTTFETPAAVEGTPTEAEIADSVATTIFNAIIGRVLRGALDDETAEWPAETEIRPPMSTLLRMLNDPGSLATTTGDDCVFWDDLTTAEVTETRAMVVLSAFVDALVFLRSELGNDISEWRWGKLHTLRLMSLVPQIGRDVFTLPSTDDPTFPGGYPRHGDNDVVDASFYGYYETEQFSYANGPVQRLVVEMTPDGPRARNAIPGGQVQDAESDHFSDEMELWRRNEAPPMYFSEEEVVEHAERRLLIVPSP